MPYPAVSIRRLSSSSAAFRLPLELQRTRTSVPIRPSVHHRTHKIRDSDLLACVLRAARDASSSIRTFGISPRIGTSPISNPPHRGARLRLRLRLESRTISLGRSSQSWLAGTFHRDTDCVLWTGNKTSGARGASDIFRSYLGVGPAERR